MKPTHDPLDDLIAAALHGELAPKERTQFDSRLKTDAAARAAYQEAQLMHDLLEKTYRDVQPDPDFEQRMVSGVHRKLQEENRQNETAWGSVLFLWNGARGLFGRASLWQYGAVCSLVAVISLSILVTLGSQVKSVFTTISSQLSMASAGGMVESNADNRQQLLAQLNSSNSIGKALEAPIATQAKSIQDAQPKQLAKADSLDFEKPVLGPMIDPGATYRVAKTPTTPVLATTTASTPPPPIPDATAPAAAADDEGAKPQSGAPRDDSFVKANDQTAVDAGRKLIRNAELELEVKSFQTAMDDIAALTKSAGGYVDTSNSQRGGNGKLQGNVVVKVLPQNLDAFLLKLRDLGQLRNQTIKTDDVTKAYIDTQARIVNSLKMEEQLQELLKHDNGKVSELLQVERELGRVRGEIEQMQGELKLYDFQVAYATITMQLRESDLNQTAAYLLKENDDFSLFSTNVEGTFQQARHTADDFKATILVANLQHNSGSDVSAQLQVTVPPEQIEPFLAQLKQLGRVANFTRQTQRTAKDGGDSNQAADQTLTEKDRVMVSIAIHSDDDSRKRVALTVVTPTVDTALDQAKAAALANPGTEILSSSLNKAPQGQSSAQLSVRVPGKSYAAVLAAFGALGRQGSLSVQREDNSGPGATGDDAPVIVSLSLTDNDTPLQVTELSVRASDVDTQAQQLKKDAGAAGVEVIASNFQRQPDGSEVAQMIFHLPMGKYAGFIETLKKLGKVEELAVNRQDRPDQTRTDDSAPAEIRLVLHNQRDLVTEDTGLWATLRATFGEGAGALFGSVRVIGVAIAFLVPWVFALGLLAWAGRRIYVWRKR
jgi:hypothetical protein